MSATQLKLNSLFEEYHETGSSLARIVYISADGRNLASIDVESRRGMPIVGRTSDFVQAIEEGRIRVLQKDPFIRLASANADITEAERRLRDTAFLLVSDVLREAGDLIYTSRADRGQAIQKIAAKHTTSPKVLYSHLRRFWRGGGTIDALRPAYRRNRSKPKRRIGVDQFAKKLGRPSMVEKLAGETHGIRCTEATDALFRKGVDIFLNQRGCTLKMAFERMLALYFNVGFQIIDGTKVPVMPDIERLPTFSQFRYFYKTYVKDEKSERIAREGRIEFERSRRELRGDSTSMASGPGSVYMVDATIADVYLVSSFDRTRMIGRPVVYLIADVFSRMIVGFSVGLDGPSWRGARHALTSLVAPKADLCGQLGISISHEEWDCAGMPDRIIADRGEFEGKKADLLPDDFGISLHNTPPYRPDFKGIVERAFGIANERLIHFLPGTTVHRRFGEKSNALDAKLTLTDFRKALVVHILDHNNFRELEHYRLLPAMVEDGVISNPRAIWEWGIKNCSGQLRTFPQELVRMAMLDTKDVSLAREGIRFMKDIFYVRPEEVPFGTSRIKISYDENCLDEIYLRSADGRTFISCPLTEASRRLYSGRSLPEIRDMWATRKQISHAFRADTIQSEMALRALGERFVAEAVKATEDSIVVSNLSDKARLTGIRINRNLEKEKERGIVRTTSEAKSALSIPSLASDSHGEPTTQLAPPTFDGLLRTAIKKKQEQTTSER